MPGRGRGHLPGRHRQGLRIRPGEYVVITDDDLEKVPLKTVRSIEIEQFTKAERDDNAVRFVKSAYYVEPDKIGRKAFYLLKSVLEDEGLTAICKVVIKDREALAALDPFAETLLLTRSIGRTRSAPSESSTCRRRTSTSSPPRRRWPSSSCRR